jgi:hypothetical protein
MQNEGSQEAVCEGHVRAVERLMMMRDSPKCETDTITLHPTANGTERYLTAEISGDYAGLFKLVTGKNKPPTT